jgi:large subunit ribosomal protein L31
MKEGIHPTYYPEATVVCSCGNSWTVGSTVPEIRTDVCNVCHPFFTGEQRIVDAEGQVDRFYQRLERRQRIQDEAEAARQAATSAETPVDEMDVSSRSINLLKEDGVATVGQVMERLNEGEESLLRIQGFGQKSLIDVRKWLRANGYIE